MRGWLRGYGYRNVRTPVLEHTRLFARGIGEVPTSSRRRCTLHRRAQRRIADHASGNDGRHRARIHRAQPALRSPAARLFHRPRVPPRAPAASRYRQFHQIDVEALGFAGPDVDAELIVMLARLWKLLGLTDVRLELNSLGQPAERAAHRAALIEHLEKHRDILDEDGQRRMYTNRCACWTPRIPPCRKWPTARRACSISWARNRARTSTACASAWPMPASNTA